MTLPDKNLPKRVIFLWYDGTDKFNSRQYPNGVKIRPDGILLVKLGDVTKKYIGGFDFERKPRPKLTAERKEQFRW